ncbi:hypothetical protein QJS10_CPA10g00146 [Acorus calamus]|uniref:Uncharacterized protein n=1 Tax=Acorus calamus TaxID=4465 RepID=A0AAV9DXJ5_ACOCL|nr:hypothetical protein QJS10_CPA10g00146 [Acorus calamus]
MNLWILFKLLVLNYALLWGIASALKECTNIPTQSKTVRYALATTHNETWKAEMHSHYHLTPTDDSAWMDLIPRRLLGSTKEEIDWANLYRRLKNSDWSHKPSGTSFLKEVPLNNVRIDPGSFHGRAQQTNLEYLLMLDVDRLVWSFRNQSGLPTPGMIYEGWEGPTSELRGHFIGHYMSATAKMWASTNNDTVYEKMTAVVSALYDCQKKMGTGYLSAFPSELFDRFEQIQPVWAPYYTIHKIMAGLVDQYTFAGNTKALEMVVWMAEYFGNRVQNVIAKYSIERHWTSLNEETGGMNDVLYRLYSITGNKKHLILAHLFDKPCFLGMLALQADSLSNFHSNTHIPIVIGAQMRYEVTGDPLYKDLSTFFMNIVNSSHCYATGGTSYGEFWRDPKRLADTLQLENEESCTTYNMLKVSRNLFRWTKDMAYADYYERALTNGVLGIQRGTEPGVMIYMLPLGPGVSKAHTYHGWGTPFDAFWCCYGTGIESFSKLGDSIYFEEEGSPPALYIIQYISSSLKWKSGQVGINQKAETPTSTDPYLRITLVISADEATGKSSTLKLRIPFWTSLDGAKASLNDQELHIPAPGTFMSITKNWSSNDKIVLQFPMSLRTEAIKDDRCEYASIKAILYGPYLLVGLSDGDWDLQTKNTHSLSDFIAPIPSSYNSQLITLVQPTQNSTQVVIKDSKDTLTMDDFPGPGTKSTVHATFRLIDHDPSNASSTIIGKSVSLEPFDQPGKVVSHQGPNNGLVVVSNVNSGRDSVFKFVPGLDGSPSRCRWSPRARRAVMLGR